ncbi:hypothetical protein [Peribacillus frigoritolerans]|uniref:hypothetical protein n=1 Tax=Peribacillus frigoritolerans TaxID=450367 RepID=UPI0022830EBC|nr:hypothetical protein [Peribacillus frigoritolerans]MCY9139675.1 hypothetical protein [Peribacillus frigoritolerans]
MQISGEYYVSTVEGFFDGKDVQFKKDAKAFADLETKLNTEQLIIRPLRDQLAIKTAEYDEKDKKLAAANNTIKNLNDTLKYAEEKLDKLIN